MAKNTPDPDFSAKERQRKRRYAAELLLAPIAFGISANSVKTFLAQKEASAPYREASPYPPQTEEFKQRFDNINATAMCEVLQDPSMQDKGLTDERLKTLIVSFYTILNEQPFSQLRDFEKNLAFEMAAAQTAHLDVAQGFDKKGIQDIITLYNQNISSLLEEEKTVMENWRKGLNEAKGSAEPVDKIWGLSAAALGLILSALASPYRKPSQSQNAPARG